MIQRNSLVKCLSMMVACLGVPAASAVEALTPLVETSLMNGSGDVADDMCVWLHPTDRSKSIIFGNNKTDGDDPEGGIYCYALDGGPTDTLDGGPADARGWGAGNWFDQGKKVNNVDVRYNFQAGSEMWDLVVGSNRTDQTIDVFRVVTDGASGDFTGLTLVGSIPTDGSWNGQYLDGDNPYGLAMFHSKSQNKLYAIASSDIGMVAQWELSYNAGASPGAEITGTRVWMTPGPIDNTVEGIVADDEKDVVYIAGEDTSIYRYQTLNGVIQDAGRVTVGSVGDGNLTQDIEGLTMYYASDGEGYLIASSQGSSQFAVYEREFSGSAPNAYIKNFSIGANTGAGIDSVSDTDGIDVVNVNLGGSFPDGMFLAHDNGNGTISNIKLVAWGDVANAEGPTLMIDTSWDPRPAGFEAWQITHFGTSTAPEAAPGLDPDFDGMANLLEYALGKDPHVSDQPAGNFEAGVITFTKGAGARDDVTYTIEESDDLGVTDSWEAVVPTVNDANEISYILPLDKDALFVRLKVTLAE